MTYRELLDRLNRLPAERLDDTVAVYDACFRIRRSAVIGTDVCDEADNDVIDHNHLYLILKA